MSRPMVRFEGKGHAAPQNIFEPTSMAEIFTMTTKKFKEITVAVNIV